MANAASALKGTASQAALRARREIFWLGWVPLAVEAVKSDQTKSSRGLAERLEAERLERRASELTDNTPVVTQLTNNWTIVAEKTPASRLLFVYVAQSFGGCYVVQNFAGFVWAQETHGPGRQRDKASR